jgi:hypothetical protein
MIVAIGGVVDAFRLVDAAAHLRQTRARSGRDVLRSRLVMVVGVVVVVAGAAGLIWRLGFRDTATPLSPAEIVEDLTGIPTPSTDTPDSGTRAPEPVATTTSLVAPGFVVGSAPGDPGLYVYATTGFEEIDALGGARHDYPAETFVTMQPGGCGVTLRWTALEERWDELDLCDTAGGLSVLHYDAYHEWFSQADLQKFACGPLDAVAIPDGGDGSWSYECANYERDEVWFVEVVGTEKVEVAGEEVDSLHVRVTSDLSGESTGTSETDTWYLQGTSLIVRRMVNRSSVNQSLVGAVNYVEEYEIVLSSLLPQGARPGP